MKTSYFAPNKQVGMTLVELMISLGLGLFLISGAIGVFLSAKTTFAVNSEFTWIQENARFAMLRLKDDIRMAGYFGCTGDQMTSTLNPVPGSGNIFDFSSGVKGFDGNDADFPSDSYGEPYNSAAAVGFPSSDMVGIRTTNDSNVRVTGHNPKSAVIDVNIDIYPRGAILVATDCEQTTIFQSTGGNPHKIGHNTGKSEYPGNCTKAMGIGGCEAGKDAVEYVFDPKNGARILEIVSYNYYVKESPSGLPSLYRSGFNLLTVSDGEVIPSEEEVVPGVENIQAFYGLDTDADGIANVWTSAENILDDDWTSVVTMRINVLMRSSNQLATEAQTFRFAGVDYDATDRFIRQEYIATIDLRNKG